MNIAKPYAKILPLPCALNDFNLGQGVELLKRIEWCARISHRSEEAATAGSYDRFLRSVVLNHGDWSVVEHASVSVDFYVDRGITHELVRHRLFAFTQESTRFVNYDKKMEPSFINPFSTYTQQEIDEKVGPGLLGEWQTIIDACERAYKCMTSRGIPPQIARSVFPNALASRIVVTGNLRNWRHFLLMRTTKETHPQMREVTIPLLQEFKEKIPILYEDIEPMAKQADNIAKGR